MSDALAETHRILWEQMLLAQRTAMLEVIRRQQEADRRWVSAHDEVPPWQR